MGWSCAAAASLTLKAVQELFAAMPECGGVSNAMPGGFWETSRTEHPCGAITGSVWKTVRVYTAEERAAQAAKSGISNPEWVGNPCRKAGSFRIPGAGKIERFPGLSKAQKAAAEKAGTAKYEAMYGRVA